MQRHPSPPRFESYRSASPTHTTHMRGVSPHQVLRPPCALSAGAVRRDAIESDCLLAGAGSALADIVLGCARAPRASMQVQVMGMYGGYASPRSLCACITWSDLVTNHVVRTVSKVLCLRSLRTSRWFWAVPVAVHDHAIADHSSRRLVLDELQ